MAAKKRILRRDEMTPPKLGDLEALKQRLVENLEFQPDEAVRVSKFLEELVPTIAGPMSAYSSAPTPSKDRNSVRSAVKSLNKAKRYLDECGLYARTMVEPSLGPLGEAFSVGWLRKNRAADFYLPPSGPLSDGCGRTPVHLPMRSRLVDIEQDSLEARHYFLADHGLSVIVDLLAALEQELDSAVGGWQEQRGRKENIYRNYFLERLVALWKFKLQRPTTQTIASELSEFCHEIFDSVGWPTGGLDVAVQKAAAVIAHSRN